MEKRYQVFVSSTYTDLQEERQQVLQTLMELDCMPSGMELFPAMDEEQWRFIQRVIDDCDYYLLIIGGRYGSVTADGISYTEKEYDYAVDRGLKVVAFLHERPDQIPVAKSEVEPSLRQAVEAFRQKVASERLVRYWTQPDQLPGLVALSLTKTIKTYPAVGWVRADAVASEALLNEINDLRKENLQLKESLETQSLPSPSISDLADFDAEFTLEVEYTHSGRSGHASYQKTIECTLTWREMFAAIAPSLKEHPSDPAVKRLLSKAAKISALGSDSGSPAVNDQHFKTVAIQLEAYGLIRTRYSQTTGGGMALFWSLTKAGVTQMVEERVVRDDGSSSMSPSE